MSTELSGTELPAGQTAGDEPPAGNGPTDPGGGEPSSDPGGPAQSDGA